MQPCRIPRLMRVLSILALGFAGLPAAQAQYLDRGWTMEVAAGKTTFKDVSLADLDSRRATSSIPSRCRCNAELHAGYEGPLAGADGRLSLQPLVRRRGGHVHAGFVPVRLHRHGG
jgi:hypothetical protein